MSHYHTVTCYFLAVNLSYSHNALTANIITSILNTFFSVTAVCGNVFIISVIWKYNHLRVHSNKLLCCLTISDLVVGLISQPSFVIHKVAEIRGNSEIYCAARMLQSCSGWLSSGMSLVTLCAISVDRYLALKFHLRYAEVVTTRRIAVTVTGLWLYCAICVSLRFVIDKSQWNIVPLVTLLITVFVTVSAYTSVFKTVRRHQCQIHERLQLAVHFHGRTVVEVARHKRSAVTMMYILITFLLCYVPLLGTIIAERVQGYTLNVKIAYDYTATAVFLSSSLNPVLYCWRITEVRKAALSLLSKIHLPVGFESCCNAQFSKKKDDAFRKNDGNYNLPSKKWLR